MRRYSLTPWTSYRRAVLVSVMAGMLGACNSAGGLDLIASDLTATDGTAAQTSPEGETASDSGKTAATAAQEVASADAEAAQSRVIAAAGEGKAAQSGAEPAVIAAVPVQRPGQGVVEASLVAVSAYAEQKQPGSLATALVEPVPSGRKVAPNSPELHALISHYAAHYNVPERLVHRVVKRESNYDPSARNKIYWGLMQIRHDTARTMGYRGSPEGLLDAETNLKYAVKYLRGAYITAEGNEDLAVRFYSRGYYYDAKRKGLLKVTGLRP